MNKQTFQTTLFTAFKGIQLALILTLYLIWVTTVPAKRLEIEPMIFITTYGLYFLYIAKKLNKKVWFWTIYFVQAIIAGLVNTVAKQRGRTIGLNLYNHNQATDLFLGICLFSFSVMTWQFFLKTED